MKSLQGLAGICLALAAVAATPVYAIAPRYISDRELATHSVIVLAQWEKSKFRPHHLYKDHEDLGQVVDECECFTKLRIIKVIKGDAKPGEAELMVKWGIGWDKDGQYLSSGTSTEVPGDVEDITKPCLWFLEPTSSWDEKLKEKILTVDNYRQVQPAELAEFYLALAKPDADARVPKLLNADSPTVAARVLPYLVGNRSIWPTDREWPFAKREARGKVHDQEAVRVWNYLTADAKGTRPLAASVYAELAGEEGIVNLRKLLDDRDPEVRATVVGLLARRQDLEAIDRFAKALEGFSDSALTSSLIEALVALQDERAAPALMGFLQNDDWDNAGLLAREALEHITEHEFPLDVELSRKAWAEAVKLKDQSQRHDLLQKLAPGNRTAIVAKAIGSPTRELSESLRKRHGNLEEDDVVIKVELQNRSKLPVTIMSQPSGIEMRWPAGLSNTSEARGKDVKTHEFKRLEPNERLSLEVVVDADFLIVETANRQLTLEYLINGNRQGVNAWLGLVEVEFGADWKYERKTAMVEETWSNGNLKAVGSTVNGVKQGEWNYFNEEGHRIRIEYFGTGQGTAECNPEHPENKGAGKRKPK